MTQTELIGTGWDFPPAFDRNEGGARLISGIREIESSIYVILHTALGERVMRRSFGSNLHELLFEPLTENIRTYMATSLRSALETNEPRIEVNAVRLQQDDPALGRVDIHVEVTILRTREPLSLVLPYYLPEQP